MLKIYPTSVLVFLLGLILPVLDIPLACPDRDVVVRHGSVSVVARSMAELSLIHI